MIQGTIVPMRVDPNLDPRICPFLSDLRHAVLPLYLPKHYEFIDGNSVKLFEASVKLNWDILCLSLTNIVINITTLCWIYCRSEVSITDHDKFIHSRWKYACYDWLYSRKNVISHIPYNRPPHHASHLRLSSCISQQDFVIENTDWLRIMFHSTTLTAIQMHPISMIVGVGNENYFPISRFIFWYQN